jgi:hypothetical protein
MAERYTMSPEYFAGGKDIYWRIYELIQKHPEARYFKSASELMTIPGFRPDDVDPNGQFVEGAMRAAQAHWQENILTSCAGKRSKIPSHIPKLRDWFRHLPHAWGVLTVTVRGDPNDPNTFLGGVYGSESEAEEAKRDNRMQFKSAGDELADRAEVDPRAAEAFAALGNATVSIVVERLW